MANTKVTGDLIASGTITAANLVSGTLDTILNDYLTTNTYATQGYVTTAVNNLIDAAPASLDTLNELAAALNDDANFATTVTNSLATKLNLSGGTLTGDLGIGISPSSKLHLYTSADSDTAIRIQNSPSVLYIGVDNTTGSRFIGSSGSAAYIGTTTSSPIQFATANTVRATIDSSGNVGIGGTPTHKLYVRNDVAASTDLDPTSIKLYNNSDGGAAIEFSNAVAGNSKLSFGVEGSGGYTDETYIGFSTSVNAATATERIRIDSLGVFQLTESSANGYLNANGTDLEIDVNRHPETGAFSDTTKGHARIALRAEDSGAGSRITFNTASTNNTPATERLRIDSSGNVGIGTTNPGYGLHVANGVSGYSAGFDESIVVGESGSTAYNLRFANVTGAYNTFQQGSRIFQYFPDGNGTAEASIYFNRSNGTGGGVTSGAEISFHTTKNTYSPYGRETDEERLRITQRGELRLSANSLGIQFNGDTGAGNRLNDYEEGTISTSIVGITATTNSVTGIYTKIGNMVFAQIVATISGKSSGTGNPYIPLPFTPSADNIGVSKNGSSFAKNTMISGLGYLGLYGANAQVYANTTSGGYIGQSSWGDGDLSFTIIYRVN